MRRAVAALLTLAACGPGLHVGGTPGPPAVECRDGDRVCETTVLGLEIVRGNIGGWCGTPDMEAAERIFELGLAAAPTLAAALDDRDVEVGRFAAWLLVDMGAYAPVDRWCLRRGGNRRVKDLCDWVPLARKEHAQLPARLPGRYVMGKTEFRPGLRLEIAADGRRGTFCVDEQCHAVTAVTLTGGLVTITVEGTPAPFHLRFSGDAFGGRGGLPGREGGPHWIDLRRDGRAPAP
jgi:hypothetical protein